MLTRNAVVIGMLYALIWESLVGNFVAQDLSIQQWALAITEKMLGRQADAYAVSSAVGVWTALPLLLVVVAGSVTYAGHRLRSLHLTADE